jgi:hypothetical protein
MRQIDGSEFTDCTFAAKPTKRAKGCHGVQLGDSSSCSRLPFYDHCPNGGMRKQSLLQAAIDLGPQKFGTWCASFSDGEECNEFT